MTTFLLVEALATVPGGWLADRYGRVPSIALGYALMVPALPALLWAPTLASAVAAAALS